VSGYGSIAGSACQVLSIFVGDVFPFTIFKTLGQPKVNNVDLVFGGLSAPDQEIIGLDISVDYALVMGFPDPIDHLTSYQQAGLEVEGALAGLEKILERRSQLVHYHNMERLVWN